MCAPIPGDSVLLTSSRLRIRAVDHPSMMDGHHRITRRADGADIERQNARGNRLFGRGSGPRRSEGMPAPSQERSSADHCSPSQTFIARFRSDGPYGMCEFTCVNGGLPDGNGTSEAVRASTLPLMTC